MKHSKKWNAENNLWIALVVAIILVVLVAIFKPSQEETTIVGLKGIVGENADTLDFGEVEKGLANAIVNGETSVSLDFNPRIVSPEHGRAGKTLDNKDFIWWVTEVSSSKKITTIKPYETEITVTKQPKAGEAYSIIPVIEKCIWFFTELADTSAIGENLISGFKVIYEGINSWFPLNLNL